MVEKGDEFYFTLDGGVEEPATLIRYKPESFVRFRVVEEVGTKYFFELIFLIEEITDDLSLNITDVC